LRLQAVAIDFRWQQLGVRHRDRIEITIVRDERQIPVNCGELSAESTSYRAAGDLPSGYRQRMNSGHFERRRLVFKRPRVTLQVDPDRFNTAASHLEGGSLSTSMWSRATLKVDPFRLQYGRE